MQTICEKIFNTTGEYFYETYSAIVYRIALKISPDEKSAEEILISTFKKLYGQTSTDYNQRPLRVITLIRLVIKTARERADSSWDNFFMASHKRNKGSKEQTDNNNLTDLKIDKLFCNSAGFHRSTDNRNRICKRQSCKNSKQF
jgi:hypothetical protein